MTHVEKSPVRREVRSTRGEALVAFLHTLTENTTMIPRNDRRFIFLSESDYFTAIDCVAAFYIPAGPTKAWGVTLAKWEA